MKVNICKLFAMVFSAIFLVNLPALGQQPGSSSSGNSCPVDKPGVYMQDSGGWQLLSQTAPAKMKAKHAFLSSMSYGTVSAPMIVEYTGTHARVQIHYARPVICVSHIIFPNPPVLVRLNEKKQTRELDSGSLRAVPFANDSKQGHASAGSLVPTATIPSEDGTTLLQPKNDLPAGEYAVMFGVQNLANLDFGVEK